ALGTVCERKGQLDLVEAVGRLENEWMAQVQCFIVGDRPGTYSKRLHAARQALCATRRSRVNIVSETAEAALYYSAADLYVCSSRVGSFPRVILDAMACRLPIITTPVFGIVEQVRPNINGLFYQPGDVGALASAIRRLIKDRDFRRRLTDKSIAALETINDYD